MRMRGKLNNFTVILVHAPNREKNKLVKDSLYVKLNQIYQRIPEHDTKIIVGNFNTKIGREGIFKPVIGSWSLHEMSNDNGNRTIDFATNNNNNNMTLKSTHFPRKTYMRRLGNPLMEELIIILTTYVHIEGVHQALWVYEIVELQTMTWITS